MTAGRLSYRKVREVVRIHLGIGIYISNIHYCLNSFNELMKMINGKIVGMNIGFLRRLV